MALTNNHLEGCENGCPEERFEAEVILNMADKRSSIITKSYHGEIITVIAPSDKADNALSSQNFRLDEEQDHSIFKAARKNLSS
ncbi:hypothetical protein DRJ25_04025 [Candidatus Woesearchaeota archaeon]|nr:MAG: hypothetical protein DRJ25_04025 [Candidatus Woesearchaeota archaeon]